MPALDPLVIQLTQLGMKFPRDPNYSSDRLLRDMRDYLQANNDRIAQLEAMVVDHETRLLAGGH